MALRRLFEDLKGLRPQLPLAHAADLRRLREVLVGFLPGQPGAIASLLRDPAVAAPLRCLRDGTADPRVCASELVGQSLFQLALDGSLRAPVQVDCPPRTLVSVRHRTHLEPTGPWQAPPGLQLAPTNAFTPIIDAHVLCTVDTNPLRHVEAHPDKSGSLVDLGDAPATEWVEVLRAALGILAEHMPASRREADLLIRQFVPVGSDETRHESATYREAIGTVYLSLHPDPLVMAEAIVHELSHTKLHALLELDPLLQNASDERYPSPIRPDARPILGVLLALHAFAAVAALYDAMIADGSQRSERLQRRRAALTLQNADAWSVLSQHARPTPVGAGILDELQRLQ